MLQNVNHPNIVRVIDLFEDSVNFYIVTELMKGGELYDHMINVKRLSERQAASIIKQCLQAITYMHSQNIVHRDIKPENILLTDESEITVKITDFGLACPF